MNLSKDVQAVFNRAVFYASDNKFEFLTPEMILLSLCEDDVFLYTIDDCGGNAELLAKELDKYIKKNNDKTDSEKLEISYSCGQMMAFMEQSAANSGSDLIYIRHMVHAIWNLQESYAVYFMQKQGLNEADMLEVMTMIEDGPGPDGIMGEYYGQNGNAEGVNEDSASMNDDKKSKNLMEVYAPCLNETLKDINPLIGREEELDRTIQILCRKDKNNPLHIGEPGVGKTAITYGLVEKIRKEDVPEPLIGARIYALDLGGMIAGTQYRGDFEKRFKKVLGEIAKEEKPVIYIDEIHNLCGAGATSGGSLDASNMLKPYLTDGHIRFIGATTFEEYKKYFEKNRSLVRRFQNVEIKEPSEEETVKILEGLKGKYEKYHGVKYSKGLMEYVVHMSAKHINERFLPDKAIDLIDEAGAYRKLHPTETKTQTVNKEVINTVLTKICRVPIETVETDDVTGLSTLENRLKKRVFGQDEALSQVVNAVKYSKAGLSDENKPIASLLFVGPTGVGKTEIAKSLAEELGIKLIRFDMSEYGEKHAVAKLIGSPAGYVGYEEGGLLTEAIRKNPSAVLLLDEIEKAHSDIYNVLLQVMDYATLTDNQGRKADFRNVIIIMTSNAGASLVGKSGIGFQTEGRDSSAIMESVKNTFQPEFRNRLNKIVVFNGMDQDMASRIVDKKLSELANILEKKKIVLTVTDGAKELIREIGVSQNFGAREVDRVIRNDIKPLFVDEILFGKLKKGGGITLSAEDGHFTARVARK